MEPQDESRKNEQAQRDPASREDKPQQRITHNLDTGKDEPLPDLDAENIMDFGSGSGGGSATDG
jgi:hypothetical protein